MLSQSGPDTAARPSHFPTGHPLMPTLSKLLSDARDAVDSDAGTVQSCLTQALALLRRNDGSAEGIAVRPVRRGGFAPWQEQRILSYIEQHLDGPIRIADLAALSRLSVSYFSVAFRQSFGLSLQTFIAQRRVERAQRLMLTTNQTLTDIALACGFCDQAHFCRRFRQITGQTPNAWRRTCAGAPAVKVKERKKII